ncbi:MAG: hypothetical protein OWQ48_01585 [Desulfurococcus sp.]|nr:hypothetical protein [Desulfurococcus sp.]
MASQPAGRQLGRIRLNEVSLDVMESIVLRLDNEVFEYISSKLPKGSNVNTVISIELEGDHLNLKLDLEASGPFGDLYDYEQILQDAINHARVVFEKLIEKYRS